MKKLMLVMLIVCLVMAANAQGLIERFQQKYNRNEDFPIENITAKMFQMISLAAHSGNQ